MVYVFQVHTLSYHTLGTYDAMALMMEHCDVVYTTGVGMTSGVEAWARDLVVSFPEAWTRAASSRVARMVGFILMVFGGFKGKTRTVGGMGLVGT